MNDTRNLINLPLLLICNDLLKINSFPSEKIKKIIYLGRSAKRQEFITVDIIELVFNCLNYDDDDLTFVRSFIMRCLEVIPLESEVRLILYKHLFSRKPFQLINVIIEEIFVTENQEKDEIFFILIKNPERALQQSIRLCAINDCLNIENSDMMEICCEIIQPFFNGFELKKLIPYFKHLIEHLIKQEDLALQQISALQQITLIAFLKEFTYKFWNHYMQKDKPLVEE